MRMSRRFEESQFTRELMLEDDERYSRPSDKANGLKRPRDSKFRPWAIRTDRVNRLPNRGFFFQPTSHFCEPSPTLDAVPEKRGRDFRIGEREVVEWLRAIGELPPTLTQPH
jgi:hypothetical protein